MDLSARLTKAGGDGDKKYLFVAMGFVDVVKKPVVGDADEDDWDCDPDGLTKLWVRTPAHRERVGEEAEWRAVTSHLIRHSLPRCLGVWGDDFLPFFTARKIMRGKWDKKSPLLRDFAGPDKTRLVKVGVVDLRPAAAIVNFLVAPVKRLKGQWRGRDKRYFNDVEFPTRAAFPWALWRLVEELPDDEFLVPVVELGKLFQLADEVEDVRECELEPIPGAALLQQEAIQLRAAVEIMLWKVPSREY